MNTQEQQCSLRISDTLGQGLSREATKDDRMHRTNPGACQHGNCMANHQTQQMAPLCLRLRLYISAHACRRAMALWEELCLTWQFTDHGHVNGHCIAFSHTHRLEPVGLHYGEV